MDATIQKAISEGVPELKLRAGALTIPLLRIEAGQFMMGSPPEEEGHQENEPLRAVRLTKPFYMASHQLTQAQYMAILGDNPSIVKDDTLAVDQVLFSKAIEFCKRLSAHTGAVVTLPTEAQWEYACRAGTRTRFYTGDSKADLGQAAWYSGNSGGHVHPPGKREPNPWGLYDMLGNVWEFCSDFIRVPTTTGVIDLHGEQSELIGAMRGGGWMNDADSCRAARRSVSNDMFGGAGIRIALNP